MRCSGYLPWNAAEKLRILIVRANPELSPVAARYSHVRRNIFWTATCRVTGTYVATAGENRDFRRSTFQISPIYQIESEIEQKLSNERGRHESIFRTSRHRDVAVCC